MKFCDLHTHVLPGVDDGAPGMEYALEMLRNAAASDVELLAVTPHCNRLYEMQNHLDDSLLARFSQLQQAAKDIPVRLVLGAEVLADEILPQLLRQKKLPTINGSRYLLTEFPVDASPDFFQDTLQSILALGYIPLVAHPERYPAVCQRPQIVAPWLDMGCHLQLTGGSIMGAYGKTVQRTAVYLLQQDLVACVASDAHGLHHRSNFLLDVYDHLCLRYSKHYAGCLMYEIPMGICCDSDL
jgi:protein-tyrosine phosphatase